MNMNENDKEFQERARTFANELYNGNRLPCPKCGKEQENDESAPSHIFYFKCPYCGFTVNIN